MKVVSPFARVLMAVSSGLLLTGAFPKSDLDFLAWIAFIPLFFALNNLPPAYGFRIGFVAGLTHYLTLMYWVCYAMIVFGHVPVSLSIALLFLFSCYLAFYIAFFSLVLTFQCFRSPVSLIFTPVLWVSVEYLRSFLFTGFPWEMIGYSQYKQLHLIQISDIIGVYGVSFLVVTGNIAIFIALLYFTKKRWQNAEISKKMVSVAISVFCVMFLLTWFYGKWRIWLIDEKVRVSSSKVVSIIQGNINQGIKWDPEMRLDITKKHIELSISSKKDKPDLVVWPETAAPFYFTRDVAMTDMVKDGVREVKACMLVGSPSYILKGDEVEYYNSAYLLSPDGTIIGKYDKAHLVPFGEYVPLKKWLPFSGKIVENVGDFCKGKKGKILLIPSKKGIMEGMGVQICYEIIFPQLCRLATKNGAKLIVNITNDAWYGTTSAPYQHFSMTVFRAVENRRALVRSANTGISGFIDPCGRIIAKTALFKEAVLTKRVQMLNEQTIYTRFGDLFAAACLMMAISQIIIYTFIFRRRKK